MNKIINYSFDIKKIYFNNSLWSKIKDGLYLKHNGNIYIKNLDTMIKNYRFPPNFDRNAYHRNLDSIKRKNKECFFSPQGYRIYDYNYYTTMQKKVLAYSIVESIRSILRLQQKSLFDASVLINNADYPINKYIIYGIAEWCKYITLVYNDNLRKKNKIVDYVVTNFGVSPIITNNINYAIKKADFIVTATPIIEKVNCPIWYLDNSLKPNSFDNIHINNVCYKTEWTHEDIVSPEMLGAFLGILKERSLEKGLENNKIYLDKIKFNNNIIYL